jgi:hypothetical protein
VATFWKTDGKYPDYFFSFGKEEKQAILYIRDIKREEFIRTPPELFSVEFLALKNISETKRSGNLIWLIPNMKVGHGSAIILLSSLSHKGYMESAKTFHDTESQKNLKEYLKEEDIYDFSSAEVKGIVQKIIRGIPTSKRNNPYWKARDALQWTHDSIKYSRVPRVVVSRVENTIHVFPNDGACSILRKSFSWNELPIIMKKLEEFCGDIILNRDDTDLNKALCLLNEFDRKCPVFFNQWLLEKFLSASKTIRDGTGKCDCMAHVFVALCRGMGIPAVKVEGYAHFDTIDGWHAWTMVYLHPYGWMETDPTNEFYFGCFNHDTHLYHFLSTQFAGEINFLTPKKPITEKMLNTCKHFYEQSPAHPSAEKLLEVMER